MNSTLLPTSELSATEKTIIVKSFSDPAVQKYLQNLAKEIIMDIVSGEPQINETAESYLRRQATVKGRLEVINTLLLIQAAP